MNVRSKDRGRRGSSLIQVLIALGLTTMLALGIATALGDGFKGQKALSIKSSLIRLDTLINLQFSSSENCTRALVGQVVPTDAAPNVTGVIIKDPADGLKTWLQTGFSEDGYTIKKISFEGRQAMLENYILTKLLIHAEVTASATMLGPSSFKPIVIPLILEVEPGTNKVKSCGGESSVDYTCVMQGGSMLNLWGGMNSQRRCFFPGDLSGTVVWMPAQQKCQYPDEDVSIKTNVAARSPAYCHGEAVPCCRKGFKRTRLGEASAGAEKTYSCYFVKKNFCLEAGQNGCECN
ncbi:MAG: hypothetical protein OM95_03510 [Bdellovibrio sp. ArHS]|uniref:type IV pilus modification PilV family protein n=1 Tax=Bdellovibrio sp. ArHS TaxID=1569284 RepID=UPI000582DF84|nr:hypothetical protein [Bdellovibrio sp. ArHS]KHD89443.1 MAG: hypothetical protein OM95_03510 [Bdellovibrio sp. ArHS]